MPACSAEIIFAIIFDRSSGAQPASMTLLLNFQIFPVWKDLHRAVKNGFHSNIIGLSSYKCTPFKFRQTAKAFDKRLEDASSNQTSD